MITNKKFVVFIAVVLVLSLFIVYAFQIPSDEQGDLKKITNNVDIVMTPQSSRPGCDKTDSCYVPSSLTISVGQSVTWKNQDSGFHTVTSGTYGSPDDLFDSGHIDPDDVFIYSFTSSGTFNFFCTLHPWMYGKIIVQ